VRAQCAAPRGKRRKARYNGRERCRQNRAQTFFHFAVAFRHAAPSFGFRFCLSARHHAAIRRYATLRFAAAPVDRFHRPPNPFHATIILFIYYATPRSCHRISAKRDARWRGARYENKDAQNRDCWRERRALPMNAAREVPDAADSPTPTCPQHTPAISGAHHTVC